MTLKVSASHKMDRWQLVDQPFALVEAGEYDSYRVGGDHANGYYASAPEFGCGKARATPAEAIRDILLANGCYAITID